MSDEGQQHDHWLCVDPPLGFGGVKWDGLDTLRAADYGPALELVRRVGFRYVAYGQVQQLTEAAARSIRNTAAELGLAPTWVHSVVLGSEAPEAYARYRAAQPVCARIAAALGAGVLVDHTLAGGTAPDLQRDVDRLGASADEAARFGLTLGVENVSSADPGYTRQVVDALNRPDVGCVLDTGHAALAGVAPQDAARILGRRIVATHLQDTFGETDDHLPPGLGHLDWNAILSVLDEVGYRGPLVLEIGGAKPRRSVAELRDIGLEKALVLGHRYLTYIVRQLYESKGLEGRAVHALAARQA
ncbi:MAG: sugar phosphate isomerase/epimerase [Chloroflexi bacterium]|nr:sugar phosphate isomerase/epimerase [Chloroflexota bacterium]